jgi:hypothetical protein
MKFFLTFLIPFFLSAKVYAVMIGTEEEKKSFVSAFLPGVLAKDHLSLDQSSLNITASKNPIFLGFKVYSAMSMFNWDDFDARVVSFEVYASSGKVQKGWVYVISSFVNEIATVDPKQGQIIKSTDGKYVSFWLAGRSLHLRNIE